MSEQMNGNPHYEASEAAQTEHGANVHALMAKTYEQRTANLIAAHQASNLIVNDADRLELEQQILKRIGIHDV